MPAQPARRSRRSRRGLRAAHRRGRMGQGRRAGRDLAGSASRSPVGCVARRIVGPAQRLLRHASRRQEARRLFRHASCLPSPACLPACLPPPACLPRPPAFPRLPSSARLPFSLCPSPHTTPDIPAQHTVLGLQCWGWCAHRAPAHNAAAPRALAHCSLFPTHQSMRCARHTPKERACASRRVLPRADVIIRHTDVIICNLITFARVLQHACAATVYCTPHAPSLGNHAVLLRAWRMAVCVPAHPKGVRVRHSGCAARPCGIPSCAVSRRAAP